MNDNIALIGLVLIMVIGLFVSYKYGTFMIRHTGQFVLQSFISATMIVAIDMLAIISWTYFTWGTSELLFASGILLGTGLLVLSEILLVILLIIKRKQLKKIYNDK